MRGLLFAVAAIFAAAASGATGKFEPLHVDDVQQMVWDRDYEFFMSVSQLFSVPEGIDPYKDMTAQGVEVAVSSSDPDVVAADYNVRGENGYVRYTLKKDMCGIATVDVAVTYEGQTVGNSFRVDVAFVRPKARLDVTLDINELVPAEIDVLGSAQFWDWRTKDDEMKRCEINIRQNVARGAAEVVTGEKGYPVIVYTPSADSEDFTKERLVYEIVHPRGQTTSGASVDINIHHNLWATRILELLPAPGQFTNTMTLAGAETALARHGGYVTSLGSFGGYIVYGFDAPVVNDPRNPYGIDFQISGNPLNAGKRSSWWSEAGAVQVMKDLNGNGLPDDGEWYELAGSDYWLSSTKHNLEMTYYNPDYQQRYTVPFTTDQGFDGAVLTNNFHRQPYYPLPANYPASARDQITFTGNLIAGVLDKRSPSFIEYYRGPAFGYCDNWGSSLDPSDIVNPYNLKEAYDKSDVMPQDGFDISWAVDKDGNHVELDRIDFVRVYCALWANAGWLGEASTEPGCIVMTIPDENYQAEDVYLNYAGITQLQVVLGHTCRFEGLVFCNGRPVTDGIDPRWTVENENVGTIDNTGLFTAKGLGKTKVTFRGTDKAIADVFEIQVVNLGRVVVDLEGNASGLDNSAVTCIEGETLYINVESETAVDEAAGQTTASRFIYDSYTWENSDPSVGTVSNALFKALKPGVATLTVSSGYNPELKAFIEVTVEAMPELEQLITEVEIAEDALTGKLTSSQIFKAGDRGSMVYLESFCRSGSGDDSDTGALTAIDGHLTLDPAGGTLAYDFNGAEDFDSEEVALKVTNHKREFIRTIRFFKKTTGVNNVSEDAVASGDAMWYSIQGVFLGRNLDSADMPSGIYIIRQGDKVRKILL